ncbi:MAG TPA: FAD-binding protein [Acidimicrobiales bacterium]|nr:FAD-binding protein [Acidimicrobiales bacterium]
MPERVVIVGGGVGGLMSALAFGRAGHEVIVLERDPLPPTADAEEAFVAERRGAPQVHQTHGFLARLQVLLRDRFPDVLDELLAVGGSTLPMTRNLGPAQPGDEDLRVIIVRRTTLEWVLRTAALAQPHVEVRTDQVVTGLLAGPPAADGTPVVRGVRLQDGAEVEADLVVACTGRRGDLPGWLGELGVAVPETIHESGLMYLTRWYRTPDVEVPLDAKLGGDLGFVKFLGIPGDGGTLSVTLAVRTADGALRNALSVAERFDQACEALPGPDIFFRAGPLEPIGGVRPMTGLLNRLRRFTDEDGRPAVLGFHAVGDCHTTTNPLYGRGCSLAAVQAVLLADAAAAHPGDAAGRANEYEAACRREVEPWFEASVQMDRMGADPLGRGLGGDADNPMGKAFGALFAAAATDPILGRALARLMNLLTLPGDLMADPAVLARASEVMADPDAYPLPTTEGPSREELLEALAAEPAA